MISVSERWTGADRGLLGSIPLLAAMLPMVDGAHRGLLRASTVEAEEAGSRELAELSAEGHETDRRHDNKGRGMWNLLGGLIDLADTPEEAERYTALRDRLMPEGLPTLRASWEAEAGHAHRLEAALGDAAFATQLREVTLPGRRVTLLDAAHAMIAAGRRLGEIEARRGVLKSEAEAARAARAADPTPSLLTARNQWIRVVNALLAALELVEGLSDEARHGILGPYQRAVQAADRRARLKRGPHEPARPADPTPKPS